MHQEKQSMVEISFFDTQFQKQVLKASAKLKIMVGGLMGISGQKAIIVSQKVSLSGHYFKKDKAGEQLAGISRN